MVIVNGWRKKYLKPRKPRAKMKCYVKRNEKLSELGYATYQEYLASDDWKRLRERRLRNYPNCLLCDGIATQVHHQDYSTEALLGFDQFRLVTMCDSCHHKIEFRDDGSKRCIRGANHELYRLAALAGKHRWITMQSRKHKGSKKSKRNKRRAEKRQQREQQ